MRWSRIPFSSSGSLMPSASVSSDVGEVLKVNDFIVPFTGIVIVRSVTSTLSGMPSASVSLSVGFEPYVFTSVPSDSVSPSESAEPVPFGRVVIRAVRFIEPANANQCKVSAPLVPEISRRSVALAFVRPSTRRLRSAVDPSVAYHARNRGAAVKFFGNATVAGFVVAPTVRDPRVQVARADASDWGAIATYPTVSAGCASPAFTRIRASKPANVGERTRAAATSGSAYD